MLNATERYAGALLGTAVGDSLGLPFEGMSRRGTARTLGTGPLEQRLVLGRGMCSDDSELTCSVAHALATSRGRPRVFQRVLASQLKAWLLTLPAGLGWGTLRGTLKLLFGVHPDRSGVRSAGNGAAMRAALLGFYAPSDLALVRHLARMSTRLTHTDRRAEQGARAVAIAAAVCDRDTPDVLQMVRLHVEDPELLMRLDTVGSERSCHRFADELGLSGGVTGYVYDTVPVALHCWLRHRGSFSDAVESAIRLGGDTDTVAAITGALAGGELGSRAIPPSWLSRLAEWPRDVPFMRRLARCLADGVPPPTVGHGWLTLRNLGFMSVVCAMVARRALPPW